MAAGAIDALVGKQTREHDDLDLVVAQSTLAAAEAALGTLGYRHDATLQPGLPARVVLLDSDRREIDLHPIVLDAYGNGWQPLGDGAWGSYPADGLTGTGVVRRTARPVLDAGAPAPPPPRLRARCQRPARPPSTRPSLRPRPAARPLTRD